MIQPGTEIALTTDVDTMHRVYRAGEVFTVVHVWIDGIGMEHVKLDCGLIVPVSRISNQLCDCDAPLIRTADVGGEYCGICGKDLD